MLELQCLHPLPPRILPAFLLQECYHHKQHCYTISRFWFLVQAYFMLARFVLSMNFVFSVLASACWNFQIRIAGTVAQIRFTAIFNALYIA